MLTLSSFRKNRKDTRAALEFWRSGEHASIENYWNSRSSPLRTKIAETVAALAGRALLEVGCHCGVNLWAVDRKRRFDRMVGVDVSPLALASGRRLLTEVVSPFELIEAPAHKLPFKEREFDIVLSAATLMCVGPTHIDVAIRQISRVAGRYVVLVEPLHFGPAVIDPQPGTNYWLRDYIDLFRDHGLQVFSNERLPRDCSDGHMNSIMLLRKN